MQERMKRTKEEYEAYKVDIDTAREDRKQKMERGKWLLREKAALLTDQWKLRFIHIRKGEDARGGLTIALHQSPGSRFIRLSIATCSQKDVYSKLMGRYISALRFDENRTIDLPLPKDTKKVDGKIYRMFQDFLL